MRVARARKLSHKRIRVTVLIWSGVLAFLLSVSPIHAADNSPTRRVHAPYFSGSVLYPQTAIFWFGRITPTENYTDVRIGYNDTHLYVNFAVADRRLGYAVTVTTSSRAAILNQAILTQTATVTDSAYAIVFVDPLKAYLPVVSKR